MVAAAPGRVPAATRVRGPTDTVNTPLSRASGRPASRPASRIPRVWEIAENFTGSTLEKRKAVPIKDARDFRPPVTGPFEQGRVRPSGRWPELLLECRETGDL